MDTILNFVATHQVAIGLVGTLIVVLAVIVASGRRHGAAMDARPVARDHAPPAE